MVNWLRVLVIAVVVVLLSSLGLFFTSLETWYLEDVAGKKEVALRTQLDETWAIFATGPKGNMVIMPLMGDKVAIAGEVIPSEALYRDYEWEAKDDATVIIYRRVRSSHPGNPFYTLKIIMERPPWKA